MLHRHVNIAWFREHAVAELSDYLNTQEKLKESEARTFFRQLVSAIDQCHQANVIHRDLKLDNILLNEKGEILVSDFGLGRVYYDHNVLSEVHIVYTDILWHP